MEEVKIAADSHTSESLQPGLARTYRLSPSGRSRHRTARRVIAAEIAGLAALVAAITLLI